MKSTYTLLLLAVFTNGTYARPATTAGLSHKEQDLAKGYRSKKKCQLRLMLHKIYFHLLNRF